MGDADLPVVYISAFAIGLAVLGTAPDEDKDVSALHEANTNLQNEVTELKARLQQRHLTDENARAITRVLQKGLHDLRETLKASPEWTSEQAASPIYVQIYAGENDRETTRYRDDFDRAFTAGGFGVALGELVGTVGHRENEPFIEVVAVLRGKATNVVRPFVLEALRAGGITTYECDDLPQHMAKYDHGPGGYGLGAVLVVGPRG